MSHLHIPDGLLPMTWVAVWSAFAIAFFMISMYMLRRNWGARIIARISIFAAVMILAMSVEWFGVYHLNLAVLAGILLGPWAGFIAQALANVILALMGHGGITSLGLNIVIVGTEAMVGYLIFKAMSLLMMRAWSGRPVPEHRRPRRLGLSAFVATIISLMISFSFMVSAVGFSLGGWDAVSETLAHNHNHLESQAEPPDQSNISSFSLSNFVKVMAIPALVGWPAESILVAAMVSYIASVRPGFFDVIHN